MVKNRLVEALVQFHCICNVLHSDRSHENVYTVKQLSIHSTFPAVGKMLALVLLFDCCFRYRDPPAPCCSTKWLNHCGLPVSSHKRDQKSLQMGHQRVLECGIEKIWPRVAHGWQPSKQIARTFICCYMTLQ